MMLYFTLLFAMLASFVAGADEMLYSTSLNTCQVDSGFTASHLNVVYTPGNNSVAVKLSAISTIEGNVLFKIAISAYGYNIQEQTINPCEMDLMGFCPMVASQLGDMDISEKLGSGVSNLIPSIAYNFPDIDAKVQIRIIMADTGEQAACIEAPISNGKTVDLVGVKWATALVVGLALVSAAVLSSLGHYNAASHVAASALSLASYYQAQAMVGLVEIPLPPVVQSWTQNFQWTIGIVNVGFLQDIYTWYLRSTGGTPSSVRNSVGTVSVEVQKRAVEALNLFKRNEVQTGYGAFVISGPDRVAFREEMDVTNFFLTGLVTFCIVMVFCALLVVITKFILDGLAKAKIVKPEMFMDFRSSWLTTLKGLLYRITLIGYTSVVFLSLWELKRNDSPALMVLAVTFLLGATATLGWAAYTVIGIAKRSITLHKNPAYALFAEDSALNRWGFLYIQFRASAYYFVAILLGYMFAKSVVIAYGSGVGQAIALLLLEAAALITASVMRPWMDKKMNSFNIAICAINFINSICALVFTEVFDQPDIVTSVFGVVFWVLNAVFTTVLLLMLIISTLFILFRENPDTRYRFMGDDRTSFIKSQTHLETTTQLDALGMAARGSSKSGLQEGFLPTHENRISQSSGTSRPQSYRNRE